MDFSGKVVLITGAASGIGADAARHLAQLGAKVSIVDKNEEQLKEVANQIIKAGSTPPLIIGADITTDTERIINETIKHFGQLDVLVNNAGILKTGGIADLNLDDFDLVMNVNLKSAIILTKLAVPHLEKTKGNIVNVSSVAGLQGVKDLLSYCISKAGVTQFTNCAAIDLSSKGIRVNAICPGVIRTPIYRSGGMTKSNIEDEFFKRLSSNYLVGRVGNVSDTSSAIAYLASAPFINGIQLRVDGGLMTGQPQEGLSS